MHGFMRALTREENEELEISILKETNKSGRGLKNNLFFLLLYILKKNKKSIKKIHLLKSGIISRNLQLFNSQNNSQ